MDYRNLTKPMFGYDFQSKFFVTPAYLFLDVPDPVKKDIKGLIKTIRNDEMKTEDARSTLAGHLTKEVALPITDNIKYLAETLSEEYVSKFSIRDSDILNLGINDLNDPKFDLKKLWINFGEKHDFNPIHTHTGAFSFVIWAEVPYVLKEEEEKYSPRKNMTGRFFFTYLNPFGGLILDDLPVDQSWEWKMVFFPAQLNHGVFPFHTSSKQRISISGNVFLTDKPIEDRDL